LSWPQKLQTVLAFAGVGDEGGDVIARPEGGKPAWAANIRFGPWEGQ
jgi:hypothetical protein